MPKWTVLIKAGLYYKPTQEYENKVKENLLQQCANYNMLENILQCRDSKLKPYKVEKNGKNKRKSKKTDSQVMSW